MSEQVFARSPYLPLTLSVAAANHQQIVHLIYKNLPVNRVWSVAGLIPTAALWIGAKSTGLLQ